MVHDGGPLPLRNGNERLGDRWIFGEGGMAGRAVPGAGCMTPPSLRPAAVWPLPA